MSTGTRLFVTAAGCLLIAGCGTGSSQREVSHVVDRFHQAVSDEDGATACAELAEGTRSELEKEEKKPCAEAILGVPLPEGRAARAEAWVGSAAVDLDDGSRDFLNGTDKGWKIEAAGCKPQEGRPWDCELKD